MTQKEAFDLIKQTIVDCGTDLSSVSIWVTVDIWNSRGTDKSDVTITVYFYSDSHSFKEVHKIRTNCPNKAIEMIKIYLLPDSKISISDELPNLAS